jgi:hypothetical protein
MDPKRRRNRRKETEQDIDHQLEESFPASDPPSYTAGKRVGRPRRKSASEAQKEKRSVER